jgi:hypothetical protein
MPDIRHDRDMTGIAASQETKKARHEAGLHRCQLTIAPKGGDGHDGSAVDSVLQALAGRELRNVASRDVDFSAGGRVAALGGFATGDGEGAKAGETDVAAILQLGLDRFKNGINGRGCVSLGKASLLGDRGYEFVLVHVSTLSDWYETTQMIKSGGEYECFCPSQLKSTRRARKTSRLSVFSQKRLANLPAFLSVLELYGSSMAKSHQ